jgi:hypothetical protein
MGRRVRRVCRKELKLHSPTPGQNVRDRGEVLTGTAEYVDSVIFSIGLTPNGPLSIRPAVFSKTNDLTGAVWAAAIFEGISYVLALRSDRQAAAGRP